MLNRHGFTVRFTQRETLSLTRLLQKEMRGKRFLNDAFIVFALYARSRDGSALNADWQKMRLHPTAARPEDARILNAVRTAPIQHQTSNGSMLRSSAAEHRAQGSCSTTQRWEGRDAKSSPAPLLRPYPLLAPLPKGNDPRAEQ